MPNPIGFIGLGAMGAPMTRRLLQRGHDIIAYDLNAEALQAVVAAGARPAANVQGVADKAEIVFVSLPNNASCEAVAIAPGGVGAGALIRLFINLGTHGSRLSRAIAQALEGRSIAMLDAPVTGGVQGARRGALTIMVSGPRPSFVEVEPLLNCIGAQVVFVGESIGSAQTLKLANNLVSLSAFVATAEAMAMGVKAGLDPEVMLSVLNAGTARNTATSDKFPRTVLTRTFNLGATTGAAARDLMLGIEEAETLGIPLWIGSAARQFFLFALAQGEGGKDYSTLVKQFEGWAGVEIRGGTTTTAQREEEK